MFKQGIDGIRKTYHDETLYSSTEALFAQMTAHSKKAGAPSSERRALDLRRFAENEVQVAAAFLNLQVSTQPLSPSSLAAQ